MQPSRHRRKPRGTPYHFAGRKDELAELSADLDDVVRSGDASGGLTLITGVPGSGKSALVEEFAKRAAKRRGVHAMTISPSRLGHPLRLFQSIAAEVTDNDDDFMKAGGLDSKVKKGDMKIAGIGGGAEIDHHRNLSDDLEGMLLDTARKGLWKGKALVVVVDELQTLDPHEAKPLQCLHIGAHGCPILVVGAGLQHTRDVLSSNRISRVTKPITLGRLSRAETREAIATPLAEWNIEPPDDVLERLAEASSDFPEHVTNYVNAARGIVESPAGWGHPDTVDKVLREGDVLRADYYATRLRAMGDGLPKMLPVIAHMKRVGVTSLPKRKAAAVVTDAGEDNGKEAVAAAIQHGVLTVDDEDGVSFGIPSFHSHMVQLHDKHLSNTRPPRDRVAPNQHTR